MQAYDTSSIKKEYLVDVKVSTESGADRCSRDQSLAQFNFNIP